MNSTETLPKENIQDHNIGNADIDKRHISNKEISTHNHQVDVEARLDKGTVKLAPFFIFKDNISLCSVNCII